MPPVTPLLLDLLLRSHQHKTKHSLHKLHFSGFLYKNDCPAQRFIPIYLIVMGIVVTVSRICDMLGKCVFGSENFQPIKCLQAIMGCFIFGWFVAGNVWIYKAYKPDFNDASSELYCHKTLYLFAFWMTTATYIILACLCCCLGCLVCWVMVNGMNE